MSVSVKYRIIVTEENDLDILYSYSPCSNRTDCGKHTAVRNNGVDWLTTLVSCADVTQEGFYHVYLSITVSSYRYVKSMSISFHMSENQLVH